MIIEFDTEANRIVSAAGFRLEGACLRCGKCCLGFRPHCELLQQNADGTYTCLDRTLQPRICALWPAPEREPLPGCGFRWERV